MRIGRWAPVVVVNELAALARGSHEGRARDCEVNG